MAQDKTQNLFTEITTEESSTVNGGHGYYRGYGYGYGYGYRKASYGNSYYGRRRYYSYRPRYYNASYYGGYGCY